MAEICEACFDPVGYRQVLGVIARRLQEKDDRWRMAYKALLLLEYLIKHGPDKVWRDVQQSGSVLQRLQRFEYVDDNQRDHGVNVRHRAQEIQELVADEGRVREERRKAAENKAKYSGYSASQMRTASGGGGEGGSGASRVTGFGSDGGYGASQRTARPTSSGHVSPPSPRREPQSHAGGDLAIDGHDMPALDPVSATQVGAERAVTRERDDPRTWEALERVEDHDGRAVVGEVRAAGEDRADEGQPEGERLVRRAVGRGDGVAPRERAAERGQARREERAVRERQAQPEQR